MHPRVHRHAAAILLCAAASAAIGARSVAAQTTADAAPGIIPAGGEMDNYLRYLQTLGQVAPHPWSLRTLSTSDARALERVTGAHPWQQQALFDSTATASRLGTLPIDAEVRYNTTYPVGGNDGPVWAGRGATVSATGGVVASLGMLHVVIAPVAFLAQNAAFRMQPHSPAGPVYADADFPGTIDRPQRFGNRAYGQIDPGESVIRLDSRFFTAGATTANQWWGPATTYPYLLGNNAAGIPHVFVGTPGPVGIGIGNVQARVSYGLERQSAFSPVTGPDTFTTATQPGRKRFMSGLVLTFQPRGVPTLEIGAARFFHDAWRGHVTAFDLRGPFEGIVKRAVGSAETVNGIPDNVDALRNQLASAFFRWVFPHSGFEVYGEYGHEDHNEDTRDLVGEPDHSRAAMLGFRKVVTSSPHAFMALRAEVLDATAPTTARHRDEGTTYAHYILRQGHTYDGQVLGADIGVGSAAGAIVAVDRYTDRGRTTLYVRRTAQDNVGAFPTNGDASLGAGSIDGAIGIERTRFLSIGELLTGASLDYRTRPTPAVRGFNLNVLVGIRAALP